MALAYIQSLELVFERTSAASRCLCKLAYQAAYTGVSLSDAPALGLPTDSLLPGHMPTQEANLCALPNTLMSEPISTSSMAAPIRSIPGKVCNSRNAAAYPATSKERINLASKWFMRLRALPYAPWSRSKRSAGVTSSACKASKCLPGWPAGACWPS